MSATNKNRMPLGFRLLTILPLWLAHVLGVGAGLLLFCLPHVRQALIVRINLSRCFPELGRAARLWLYVRCLIHAGKTLMESPRLWAGPASRVKRRLRGIHGWDAVQAALDAGSGVIVAAPHVGSWEMAGLAYSLLAPITSLYKEQKGIWEPLIHAGRQRFGAQLVPSDRSGVRALLQALRRGETAGILPDQDPPRGSGVFAPFFGINAHTPVLTSKLAARTGAQLFIMFAERLSFGRGFVLHFRPVAAAVQDADEQRSATALNQAIEAVVREYPEQYWWAYERFRHRPAGEPRFYPQKA